MDRRALAGEIRQDQKAVAARRRRLGFLGERGHRRLRVQVAGEPVGKPMGQGSAGRQPRHRGLLARKEPWRMPEPFVFQALLRDENSENRRTVHQHHVAGVENADADCLGRRVDRADNHRRPGQEARSLSGARSDAAGDLRGPGEFREPVELRDFGRQSAAPAPLVDEIERTRVGRSVMVCDESAGQAVNEERCRIEELVYAGVDVRPVALEPENLGANRLRGQRIAAAREDRLRADRGGQIFNLARGPGVDAIKHGVHQRRSIRIDWQHAGADRARPDCLDLRRSESAFGDQLAGEPDKILPPVFLRAVLRPACLRHDEPMRPRCAPQHRPMTVDQNAFRTRRCRCPRRGRRSSFVIVAIQPETGLDAGDRRGKQPR